MKHLRKLVLFAVGLGWLLFLVFLGVLVSLPTRLIYWVKPRKKQERL